MGEVKLELGEVTFRKGDLLVLKYPREKCPDEEMVGKLVEMVGVAAEQAGNDEPVILLIPDDIDLRAVDDVTMANLGWYRAHTTQPGIH